MHLPKPGAHPEAIVQGDPLDPATMIGAQASSEQLEKILSYIDIGRQEGAKVLTGGSRNELPGDLSIGLHGAWKALKLFFFFYASSR